MRSTAGGKGSAETGTPSCVSFQYGSTSYMVMPDRSKVYDRWVEVETSRAVEILSAYRSASDKRRRRR